MKTKILALGLICLIFAFCSMLTWYHLDYNIDLAEVERPAEAKKRYGEPKISTTEEEGFRFVFEDKMIKILWLPSDSRLNFFLTNKTDYSMRIMWDEAAYVDEAGASHRVIHQGVKYAQIDDAQPPSVVVRKGTFSDSIIPTSAIFYSDGWQERYLLPSAQMGGDPQVFLDENKKLVGKNIQVLLPIQIEGITNDYIFVFNIKGVAIRQ